MSFKDFSTATKNAEKPIPSPAAKTVAPAAETAPAKILPDGKTS